MEGLKEISSKNENLKKNNEGDNKIYNKFKNNKNNELIEIHNKILMRIKKIKHYHLQIFSI